MYNCSYESKEVRELKTKVNRESSKNGKDFGSYVGTESSSQCLDEDFFRRSAM